MSLTHRLCRLEKKVRARLRHQAEVERLWQWRYQSWREEGWPRMPPRTEPLTLDQFKAAFRQAYLPRSRPPRRPRRSPNPDDAP